MANNGPPGQQLPPAQSAQMTSFSFTTPQAYQPPAETQQQKSYVFVDEHNRHKRLKVMRACEGCRKRKIKCSAANTNTWPCSACVRLKLACVRPTGYDGSPEYEDPAPEAGSETQPPQSTFQQHLPQTQQHQHPHQQPLSQPQQQQQQQQQQPFLYTTAVDFRSHQLTPLSPADPNEPPLPPQALYGVPPIGYANPAPGDGTGSVSGVSVSGISGVQHLYMPQANLQHYGPGPSSAPQPAVTATSYPVPTSAPAYSTAPFQRTPSLQQLRYQQSHEQLQPQIQVQQDIAPTTQQSVPSPDNGSGAYADDGESYAGSTAGDLADLLGTLRMDEAGTAPYLSRQAASTATGQGCSFAGPGVPASSGPDGREVPVVVETDDAYESGLVALPPLVAGPDGLKIRIPPELMPDEETVQQSFALYFEHVHPYLPVLDRRLFYEQWRTQRDSVSPLLVEALLAVGGRLADDPAQGQQWLALATRHADAFMDVPRLSTLQALLILLKAREASPKAGYYYRSWMSIVQCVQMAKDLGLDKHGAAHVAGRPCDAASLTECALKTRIWQTIFLVEIMIGSPQGRRDLGVVPTTVDVREPPPAVSSTEVMDPRDAALARQFSYWLRMVVNLASLNRGYGEAQMRGVKDWGSDPEFIRLTPLLHGWPSELPPDLDITYPEDGSPPWLPSAFIGHMHTYHYLSLLILHRPQLQLLSPADARWKHHMCVCCTAAKKMCRLVEALLQMYGVGALQNMVRGVNYTIYAVLTCLVVHLVALTSPDPIFSTDAREYFTRQMRVLEQCMDAWPMPAMQMQIDAVRKAFSADLNKPFVLKPSFPYGSPRSTTSSGPPTGRPQPQQQQQQQQPQLQLQSQLQQQQGLQQQHLHPRQGTSYADQHPITPPVSVGPRSDVDSSLNSMLQAPQPSAQVQVQVQAHMQAHVQAHIQQAQAQAQAQAQVQAQMQTQQVSAAESVSYDAPPAPQHAGVGTHTGALTWDPSRIFDQWNTTFGTPSANAAPPPPSSTSSSSVPPHPPPSSSSNASQSSPSLLSGISSCSAGTADIATPLPDFPLVDGLPQQQAQYQPQTLHHSGLNSNNMAGMAPMGVAAAYPGGPTGSSGNNSSAMPAAVAAAAMPQHTFVTPAMWQESVAQVYEGGLGIKRRWDDE